jgi:hypothetical protein
MKQQMRTDRIVVPLGVDLVEADVLSVTGRPPFVQVHLSLVSEATKSDPDRPLKFVLHSSELPCDPTRPLAAAWGVRDAG